MNQYLKAPANSRSVADSQDTTSSAREEDVTASFAIIYDIATGTDARFAPSSTDLVRFTTHDALPGASLLFLRGYASPEWLSTIGEKYRVSPELYRRHLQYKAVTSGSRDLYTSPALPSSSSRVFQLTIPTICTRNVGGCGYTPQDLQEARRLESKAMSKYFKQLRTRAKVADSVIRKCLLLSKQEYVLEQTVSIEVGPPRDDWRAVVWLDSGKDLSQSVEGPWLPLHGTRAWETYFLPVIVHQVAEIASPSSNDLASQKSPSTCTASNQATHANGNSAEEWKAAQNICLLPLQYGLRLDKELARQDALYALSELFQFAASAEGQMLNLLSSHIEHELSFVGDQNFGQYHPASLLNLKFIKAQLTSLAQRLAETVSILQNRHLLDWPRAENSARAERAGVLLLADFAYLLQRAETLARECEQGMTTLANSSILEESRRSADMAMRVQRLTVIATIFIPLSFTCSFWGMNFKEMGSGRQPLWMWLASAAPIIFLSYIVYRWGTLQRLYRKISFRDRYP